MNLNAMGSDLSNFYYFNMLDKLDEKFKPPDHCNRVRSCKALLKALYLWGQTSKTCVICVICD